MNTKTQSQYQKLKETLKNVTKKKNQTVKEFFQNVIENPKVDFQTKSRLIRNIAVIAHVDHGKSTLTDALLAETGLIQKDLAGELLATDSMEMEQERGITIGSSGVSMVYDEHLINLIDTPGHADFSGETTKSLRAIDGAIVLMDIKEGIKVQTESVITQAISEGITPILFINKLDLSITSSMLSEEKLLVLLQTRIREVNELLRNLYEVRKISEEKRTYFDLNKNVLIGSGLKKWAFMWKEMRLKYTVSQLIQLVKQESPLLYQEFNLARVLLDMVISFVASPIDKQRQRLEHLFSEDEQSYARLSEHVKSPKADSPFCGIVTNITYDKQLGWLHSLRVLSGSLNKKQKIYSSADQFTVPIKNPLRVSVSMIDKRIDIENTPTGSIVLLQGCNVKELPLPGTTLYGGEFHEKIPLPPINYTRSPMYTLAISPKKTSEVTKMIDYLKILSLEDPTICFEQNTETKQYKLSGVGVLHLEVTLDKLKSRFGIETVTGNPIIPYVETLPDDMVRSVSKMKRTPNKLNDIEFHIINLKEELVKKLINKQITNKMIPTELKSYGYSRDFCLSYLGNLNNGSLMFNMTHGALYIDVTKNTLIDAAQQALREGYWLKTPIKGIGLVLSFANLHQTKLHRSEKEYREAFKSGIKEILAQNSVIKEPYVSLSVRMPYSYSSNVESLMKLRRGQLMDTKQDYHPSYLNFEYELPLAQTFDLQAQLMSCTEGRAVFHTKFSRFVPVTEQLMKQLKTKKQ